MLLFNGLVYAHLLLVKVKNKYFIGLSFLVLFVLLGFRDVSVGTDTANYEQIFFRAISGDELRHEVLWIAFNKFVNFLGGNFQAFLVISALLTLVPIYSIYFKYSPYPLFSVLIYLTFYYYFYAFNIMRQGVASSLAFYSMLLFINGKNLRFWVCILAASFVHFSVIIVIPALYLARIFRKINLSNFIIIILQCITSIIGLFFYRTFMSYGQQYFYGNYEIEEFFSLFGTSLYLILTNLFLIFVSSIIRNKNEWYYMFVFFVLFSNLVVLIPYASRLTTVLGMSATLFLPLLLNNNRLKYNVRFVGLGIILIYSLLVFYRYIGNGGILPYTNVLFSSH